MESVPGVIMKCPGLLGSTLSCKRRKKTHLLYKGENENSPTPPPPPSSLAKSTLLIFSCTEESSRIPLADSRVTGNKVGRKNIGRNKEAAAGTLKFVPLAE